MKTSDKNRELMLARGSKNGAYDADAPDQWKFDLRHGEGEVKAIAWIKSTTIALNHESPFCVDEHGKALNLDRMALDCGWAIQTARNVAAKLEREGRIRLEKGKRIWYSADLPLAYTDLPDEYDAADAPEEREESGLKSASKNGTNNSVHGCCTTYVVDFIRKLPAEKRATAEAKIGALSTWKNEFMADGIAGLRSIIERVEDTTYLEIGVPKKRLPKRRAAECKWVQLSLLEEPNFVHGCLPGIVANLVHSENSTLHKPENGSYKAQTLDPSLYAATTTAKTLEEHAFAAAPSSSGSPFIKENPSAGGRAEKVPPVVENRTGEPPPARPWLNQLRQILKALPLGTVLDEPMFLKIASHLTEELLPQFKTAAEKAAKIRKWSGYEGIAKQVAARGLVRTAAAGGGESYFERRAREAKEASRG